MGERRRAKESTEFPCVGRGLGLGVGWSDPLWQPSPALEQNAAEHTSLSLTTVTFFP
jgi:hypothetical protein